MHKLNAQQIADGLQDLPQWTLAASHDRIQREFVLADFAQAFAFMAQIAIAAEKADHHPEWRNVYNRVCITWTTHEADGLTPRDLALAAVCDQAYRGYAGAAS